MRRCRRTFRGPTRCLRLTFDGSWTTGPIDECRASLSGTGQFEVSLIALNHIPPLPNRGTPAIDDLLNPDEQKVDVV
jgi:hypothetical protein